MLNKQEVYALEARGIVKVFPGTVALKGVDLKLKKGEVKGLLGKNGSGKSTLINILAGLTKKTSGETYFFGIKENINSVQDSERVGFRFISQEPYLMEDLSIAENIALRENDLHRDFKLINWKSIYQQAQEKLKILGLNADPKIEARYLKVSEKQLLLTLREIFSTGAKIVALDEVGTALSRLEMEKVFELIRQEKQKGCSFIYISHEIDEVFKICDSVLVIRDGEVVLDEEVKNLTSLDLKRAIVGRDVVEKSLETKRGENEQDIILKVRDLSNEKLKGINFDLLKGEILGVYGLRGSGRTELLKTLFGLMPTEKGSIEFRGENVTNIPPDELVKKGISFVPEDRFEGIFHCRPVRDNLFMSSMRKNLDRLHLLISKRKEEEKFGFIKKELDLKVDGIDAEIDYLSGGNKQKIMFGRCIAADSALFLIDEGTKGIDIGAKYEIYSIMRKMAASGFSFIYTSSDIDEIFIVSDRIMVIYNGRLVNIYKKNNINKEKLLHDADGKQRTA